MSKAQFLEDLEQISGEFVSEEYADKLHDKATEVFQEFEDEVKEKRDRISDLKEEVEGLEEQVSELQEVQTYTIEDSPFDNLRGKMIFDKMFENLKYIPVEELESLVEKHAVL